MEKLQSPFDPYHNLTFTSFSRSQGLKSNEKQKSIFLRNKLSVHIHVWIKCRKSLSNASWAFWPTGPMLLYFKIAIILCHQRHVSRPPRKTKIALRHTKNDPLCTKSVVKCFEWQECRLKFAETFLGGGVAMPHRPPSQDVLNPSSPHRWVNTKVLNYYEKDSISYYIKKTPYQCSKNLLGM